MRPWDLIVRCSNCFTTVCFTKSTCQSWSQPRASLRGEDICIYISAAVLWTLPERLPGRRALTCLTTSRPPPWSRLFLFANVSGGIRRARRDETPKIQFHCLPASQKLPGETGGRFWSWQQEHKRRVQTNCWDEFHMFNWPLLTLNYQMKSSWIIFTYYFISRTLFGSETTHVSYNLSWNSLWVSVQF